MRVVVVCLRYAGRKLTRDEIATAHRQAGELFIENGTAYLCGGSHPSEWPAHGHLLSPLHDAHVKRLRGDDFVIVGRNLRDAIRVHVNLPAGMVVSALGFP